MNRRLTFPILMVVMMVILACGPLTTPTPAPTSPPLSGSPGLEATPTERPLPTPAPPEPQPAAPPRLHAGDPVKLDFISMHTETRGWALSGPDVLTTSDGGLTWSEVTPPGDLSSPADTVACGAFFDSDTAWVVFARENQVPPDAFVWHTTNAGLTWTPAPFSHQAYGDRVWAQFAVLDADTLWMMVRGVYVGAGTHFTHDLLRSTDAGLTWTSLGGEFSDDYTGLVFASEDFGIRTRQTLGAYYFDPPAIELTSDGGATWDTHELPPPDDYPDLFDTYPYCETYQPALLSDQSIRLLVGCFDSEYTVTDFVSYLYASDDAGATWQITQLPEPIQASLYQMLVFDSGLILLLGRSIYHSTLDGYCGRLVSTVSWDGQFSFINDQDGWATGKNTDEAALARTENSAESWSLIIPRVAP